MTRANFGTPHDTEAQRKTATDWGFQCVAVSCVVELAGREKWCNTCAATQPNQRVTLCSKLHRVPLCGSVGKRGTLEKSSRVALSSLMFTMKRDDVPGVAAMFKRE